jgi:glycosyltransferase involved in cell wall biosynthesis
MKTILTIAHGHPDISKGGGEVAASNLHEYYKSSGYNSFFLARFDPANASDVEEHLQLWSESAEDNLRIFRYGTDYLMESHIEDWFLMRNKHPRGLERELSKLLSELNPDIIHIHHYVHFGLELFQILRQAAPDAKILLTLHEYIAICLHNGQMVTYPDKALCYRSNPSDCHDCYPMHTKEEFIRRENYYKEAFSYLDHITSPSQFLKSRYVDWGIPKEKISVIENLHRSISPAPPRETTSSLSRSEFAFFGQITPYKGLDILLDAFIDYINEIEFQAHLHLFATNLHIFESNFQKMINHKIKALGEHVTMHGRYNHNQLPFLMSQIDWVVVPSIWWENSPMVIQEAIRFGRPLIGSDIGGVAEKVGEVEGILFQTGNVNSLKSALLHASSPDVWEQCRTKTLDQNHESGLEYLNLLDELLRQKH